MLYFENQSNYFNIDKDKEVIDFIYDKPMSEDEKNKYIQIGWNCWCKTERYFLNIAFISLEEVSLEKICFRISEHKINYQQGGYYLKVDNIKKRKNDRYFIINIKEKTFTVKNAKKEYSCDATVGLQDIKYFLLKHLFSIKKTLVIFKDTIFMEKIFDEFEKDCSMQYIKQADKVFIETSNPKYSLMYNFENFEKNRIRVSSYVTTTSEVLAQLCYYIGNPGIEALLNNKLFAKSAFDNFVNENKPLPKGKFNEIIGVSKTGYKTIEYIGRSICENLTNITFGESTISKEKVYEIISQKITQYIQLFDTFSEQVKGLNNVKLFVEKWSEEYFFQLYYLKLKIQLERYQSCYFFSKSEEECSGLAFKATIEKLVMEFIEVINNLNNLLKEHALYKTNLVHLFDYLTSLLRKQGMVDLGDGIRVLNDYTALFELIKSNNKDLNIKFDKYPKHLKEAHDIMVMNNNFYHSSQQEMDGNGFRKAVEKYEHLSWDLKSNKKYIIITPATYNDLFVEGCSLNHCVSSYISKVIKGNSKILFMRDKKDSTQPFFTIEVQNCDIVHVKGMNQCDPEEDELKFLNLWAENKKLNMAI